MFNMISNFVESVLFGLFELAPVYITVDGNDYHLNR